MCQRSLKRLFPPFRYKSVMVQSSLHTGWYMYTMKKATVILVLCVVVSLMVMAEAYTGPWTMPHGKKRNYKKKMTRVSNSLMK